MVESVKIIKQDAFIFAPRMEYRGGAVFVAVELEIIWTLGESENVSIFVFVNFVVEQVNIIHVFDGVGEKMWLFGVPVTFAREDARIFGIFAIKIVIAEHDKGWRNFAEMGKPSRKTFKTGFALNGIKRVDEVAGNKNVIWFFGGGFLGYNFKSFGSNLRTEMNVAH